MALGISETVGEIARTYPRAVSVLESLGIDYCCGGKQTLEAACRRANVSLDEALRRLASAIEQPREPEADWTHATLGELAAHIVERHHGYIRREAARLRPMLEKVIARHGRGHAELQQVQQLFGALADELFAHMAKEERLLFPYIAALEDALRAGRTAPSGMFGSIEAPIHRMLADHDDAGELAARIRQLSNDFQPPEDACATYRTLYQGLEEFERDLHLHVHLENNVLFPHALELERGGAHVHS